MRTNTFSLAILLAMAACGSPTRPSTGATTSALGPDAAGIWSGEYRITTCDGARHCFAMQGQTTPFVLRLQQNGAALSGLLETGSPSLAIDVTGYVGTDGQITLTGRTADPSAYLYLISAELTHFEARLDPFNGFVGTLGYATTSEPGFIRGRAEFRGEFLRATRQPLPPAGAAAGAWSGQYVVRECTVTGSQYCQPYDRGEFTGIELLLTQRDTTVSGTVTLGQQRVPVEGHVSDGRLTLQGSSSLTQGQNTSDIRLTDWMVNVDAIGRLSGSIAYTHEWRFGTGPRTLTIVTRAELRNVVLRPDR